MLRSLYRDLPEHLRSAFNFNSRWLPLDGAEDPGEGAQPPLKMHFVDEGPDDAAEAVVCVHGNPTWSFYYRRLIAALRDEVRVIVPDHIGMGLSDKPAAYPYRLATHIANLETLLDSLNIERVSLVMHDWGGAIGCGLAVRRPERIARLVVLNTAAFPVNRIPLRIAVCRIPLLGAAMVRGLNGFARAATWMATTDRKALQQSGAAEGLLWPYRRVGDRIAIHRFVQDIPMNPRHPSWPSLSAIDEGLAKLADKPTFLGWGMRDFCFSPEPFLSEWQRRFPEAQVHRYPEAGHYVLEDAHQALVPAIVEFLKQRR